MNHYTQQQWSNFKHNSVNKETQLQMEHHLQMCDSCMELWLGLITEKEIDEASAAITSDFSRKTAELAQAQFPAVFPPGKSKRRRLLAYYTAAAAVTLMLVSGGAFQSIVDGISTDRAQQISAVQTPGLLYSWPEKLAQTSTEYFQKIDLNNLKEVKR